MSSLRELRGDIGSHTCGNDQELLRGKREARSIANDGLLSRWDDAKPWPLPKNRGLVLKNGDHGRRRETSNRNRDKLHAATDSYRFARLHTRRTLLTTIQVPKSRPLANPASPSSSKRWRQRRIPYECQQALARPYQAWGRPPEFFHFKFIPRAIIC